MGKYAIRYIVQKSCIYIYILYIYICSKFINTYVYMKTKYVVLIVCHPERSL